MQQDIDNQEKFKIKIIEVCNKKIESKCSNVGLSFYAFFVIKNDNPQLLMEVATRWISEYEFNHFEKAIKIKRIVERMKSKLFNKQPFGVCRLNTITC
jgi:hypothetical protein